MEQRDLAKSQFLAMAIPTKLAGSCVTVCVCVYCTETWKSFQELLVWRWGEAAKKETNQLPQLLAYLSSNTVALTRATTWKIILPLQELHLHLFLCLCVCVCVCVCLSFVWVYSGRERLLLNLSKLRQPKENKLAWLLWNTTTE